MHISRKYMIAVLFMVGMPLMAQKQKTSRIDQSLTIYNDVMRQLDINYVDTLNYDDLTETAINAMLRKIDPYTVYYPKKKDDDLRMMTTGKYGGIGSIIQQRETKNKRGEKEWQIIIANPYEGKPAQRNGVQAGDRILSVDGISTKGQTVSEVSNNLRGVPGSEVTLLLERDGVEKPFTVSFAREDIHIDPITYYCTITADTLPEAVGYIGFSEFTTNSAREFAMVLDDLYYNQGVRALIIDLRGNVGGIVDEAISIVNLFVDKGTEIVSTKGKTQNSCRTYYTTSSARFPDLPLTILVDKNSASSSEILSGSLQDLQRATLVGQRTFGKGLVQNVRPIAYDGHLKVTTSKYYLPSGRCIQAIDYAERQRGKELRRDTAGGILPDVVLSDSAKVDVCYSLYVKNMFFDYATQYHRLHDSIADPDVFTLTDLDIEDFCQFLDEQGFTYETETGKYFRDVLEMARHEDIDSTTLLALEALLPQLQPSFREAIYRNLDEVKSLLGSEIVLRYYYQRGQAAYQLRFDDELKRALSECKHLMAEKQ